MAQSKAVVLWATTQSGSFFVCFDRRLQTLQWNRLSGPLGCDHRSRTKKVEGESEFS